jgi:hypothetical protein
MVSVARDLHRWCQVMMAMTALPPSIADAPAITASTSAAVLNVLPPAIRTPNVSKEYLNATYSTQRSAFHAIIQSGYGTGYQAVWSARTLNALAHQEGIRFSGRTVTSGYKTKLDDLAVWLGLTVWIADRDRGMLTKLGKIWEHLEDRGAVQRNLDTEEARDIAFCKALVSDELVSVDSAIGRKTFAELKAFCSKHGY